MGLRRQRQKHLRPKPRLDLRKTLFVLPNLITLCGVFCGFNAIRLVSKDMPTADDVYRAALLLIFAMFFDLMDGRVARLTRTQSAFGLQLDSLADIVSFGVAPSLLVYKWALFRAPVAGIFAAFLFVAAAAVRLARFNVLSSSSTGAPTKPGKYIIGLPTPPSTGILVALIIASHGSGGVLGTEPYMVLLFAVTIGLSFLMVSNVRFRSFKELKLNTGTVLFVLFTIASSAFVWSRFRPQFVLIYLLSVYIVIGIVESMRALLVKLTTPARDSVPPVA
ncbi:MAG: CDP-diacylglycerol--serine O-phosphatidyltransferase [Myxococcales bacterium]|nr:MAG: CDP-diacylglycerol--serine O-phosphatidyltransferase [Myxococcales bacterium]